jgi:hypothetical protein
MLILTEDIEGFYLLVQRQAIDNAVKEKGLKTLEQATA